MRDMRILASRRNRRAALLWSDGFCRNESGATAVETALVLPVFLMLLFGVIQSGLLIFSQASLHYAVQKRARCVAVTGITAGITPCPDASTHYFALGTPDFDDISPSGAQKCQAATGTLTYDFNLGLWRRNISLSSTACFPYIYGISST